MKLRYLLFFILVVISFSSLSAQEEEDTTTFPGEPPFAPWHVKEGDTAELKAQALLPNITYRAHNNGKFWNTIINNGIIGNPYGYRDPSNRGRSSPGFFYPHYSNIKYSDLAALWVGGVVGEDTLVTCAFDEVGNSEFLPDFYPFGDFEDLSGHSDADFGDLTAKRAELAFRATYTDTNSRPSLVPYSEFDQRFHRPLDIKVTQTSYSWAYRFAEDFMIIDYVIENVGDKTINDLWLGFYTFGFIQRLEGPMVAPRVDDIEGYIDSWPYDISELGNEKLRLVFACDNDGQPQGNGWSLYKVQNVIGFAPLAMPPGATRNNFNWWTTTPANWGPRMQGTSQYPFRPFLNGFGIPFGDKAKYHMMYKPEIDYDGLEAGINKSTAGWLPTIPQSTSIGRGHYVHTLSSFGPVHTLRPGGTTRLTMVVAIGEFIHNDPTAYRRLYTPQNPKPFQDYLKSNIGDLINNVRVARAIYDNPGIDTDGDGDSGRFIWTFDQGTGEYNKIYYQGDGYPDFRGTGPPAAPRLRISATDSKIIIRWNGRVTETAIDNFTHLQDFEGYRVWLGRSMNEQEWSLIASYDIENYNRYRWNVRLNKYELTEPPFTMDSLQLLYGEDFDPSEHRGPGQALIVGPDSYYFLPVDYNLNDLTSPNGIRKVYPNATKDTNDVDEEGRMRYYEYEFVVDSVLPTVPYAVAVTAFDHGNPAAGIDPLENSQMENAEETFARASGDSVLKDGKLNVYVFPNPYRIDADYAKHGYENRLSDFSSDRARSIWFANLPNKCKISIFSIDGDLIKELYHDQPEGSGTASVERFDMITRNHNALTTGLFYWVIESEFGTQIGKLMVIK